VRKISVEAIYQALQMGSTAFSEAVQMIGIIDFYTAEGTNYSPEIVAEISKTDDPDPNGRIPKVFLAQWNKDHGTISDDDDN
jgi:hypothetical protein